MDEQGLEDTSPGSQPWEGCPQTGNASTLDDRRQGTGEARLRMLERQKVFENKSGLPSFKAVRVGKDTREADGGVVTLLRRVSVNGK